MKLLRYMFEIPLIAIAVWGIYNAQAVETGIVLSLWPLDTDVHVNTKLLLFCFIVYGYMWSKINSWFNYAPTRQELRRQRKANKVLNKEQEKLNEAVNGLKQNIVGLQEQAKARAEKEAQLLPPSKKGWLESVKAKFAKKG